MDFEERGDTIHCVFSGDMNTEVCAEIEEPLNTRIGRFLGERDSGQVIFDLDQVRYVSSAFLRLCLVGGKLAGGRNFSIQNVSSDVGKVFRVAGFTEMMNIKVKG